MQKVNFKIAGDQKKQIRIKLRSGRSTRKYCQPFSNRGDNGGLQLEQKALLWYRLAKAVCTSALLYSEAGLVGNASTVTPLRLRNECTNQYHCQFFIFDVQAGFTIHIMYNVSFIRHDKNIAMTSYCEISKISYSSAAAMTRNILDIISLTPSHQLVA